METLRIPTDYSQSVLGGTPQRHQLPLNNTKLLGGVINAAKLQNRTTEPWGLPECFRKTTTLIKLIMLC